MASITHQEVDAGLSLSSFFVWSFTIKDLHMTALPSKTTSMEAEDCLKPRLGSHRTSLLLHTVAENRL